MSSDGTEADGHAGDPAISADGRFVAFQTRAGNLVPGDTNGAQDVFVHDRQAGATERVSVASDGGQGIGHSRQPAISADGRFVAFESDAADLVSDDTNGVEDVFVHDRQTGTTERVSVASDGTQADDCSRQPAISADGRLVAFFSHATNLVPDDTNDTDGVTDCTRIVDLAELVTNALVGTGRDVFVHDRQTGTTERVSVASDGTQAVGNSSQPAISADGRFVAFQSNASNLVTGNTNVLDDVFVHDRQTGATERVSVGFDGNEADDSSSQPAISADGRFVAFQSNATNLVPDDTNEAEGDPVGLLGAGMSHQDVFVHDRQAGATERVSVASDGTEANNASFAPAISADGRYVTFQSRASNLGPGDINGKIDVFVHDRQSGATERASVGSDGTEATSGSGKPAVSADGRFVTFSSSAQFLVPDDTNNQRDAFVRDRGPVIGVGGLSSAPSGDALAVSGWARISGQVIAAAEDAADDGVAAARAELTGASVTLRPEHGDVLVRVGVLGPPAPPSSWLVQLRAEPDDEASDNAPVMYGLTFTSAGTDYQVWLLERQDPTSSTRTEPFVALYRCDPDCTQVATVPGSVGTTGPAAWISVPLQAIGAGEGSALTDVRAWAAPGTVTPARAVTSEPDAVLDSLTVPDVVIPAARVELGVAAAEVPADEVTYSVEVALGTGFFSATLDAPAQAGSHRVWARACVADECGTSFVEVNL